jgi:hypothetical protein
MLYLTYNKILYFLTDLYNLYCGVVEKKQLIKKSQISFHEAKQYMATKLNSQAFDSKGPSKI